MFEREPTSEDLAAIARALGLDFSRERLAAVLPGVRWLRDQADQLGKLPLDEAPAADPPGTVPSNP